MTRHSGTPRTVVAIAVLLVGLHGGRASAVTINASFAPVRVTARPGEVVTTAYQLKLQDGEPMTNFKVEVQDWWRSEDGQQSFYAPSGSLTRSCGPWVSATPREAPVSGGQVLHVRLSITVPSAVKPGGYWCALTVDETPDPKEVTPDQVGVKFLASVSTGIYVSVNPIERGVDILDIDVARERAVTRLVNTGNTPVSVEGHFDFFKPGATEPLIAVELPRNVLLTEPIPTGVFSVALPDAVHLPAGRYLVRLVLDIGLNHYIGVQRELEISRTPQVTAQKD
jgi:hypothetical protein